MDDSTTKACTQCDAVKPLSEFHRNAKSRDGRTWQCKECACEVARINARVLARREPEPVDNKQCATCGQVKGASNFHKRSVSRDGLSPHCRPCAYARTSEYRKANTERVAEYMRLWRARNPDYQADKAREWREQNRARSRELSRIWSQENPEAARALKKLWYARNRTQALTYRLRHPEQAAENQRRHRENNRERLRERQARRRTDRLGGTVEQVDLSTLSHEACGICGGALDLTRVWPDPLSKSLDHIVPLSKGGTHLRSNLQWSHLSCNLRKGAKLLVEVPMIG